ncbi:MAG: ComEC/Rec2 family competence protein [Sulfurovaceae bacterium]
MQTPPLFLSKRSFFYTILALFILFCIKITYIYTDYKDFITKPFYFTDAKVISSKPKAKEGKQYSVIKAKSSEGLSFFTVHFDDKMIVPNSDIRVQLFPDESIGFFDYLGTFFINSKIKSIISPDTSKGYLSKKVRAVHQDPRVASFYNGIFFATPLSQETRDVVTKLGVAHLVALSGFHLGILWSVIFALSLLLYRPLQARFFPYRNALLDVGSVAVLTLAFYLWYVDFPPSLTRAFTMVFLGWIFLLVGLEILSFEFLAFIVALLLVLVPSFLVSLSFWFSVAGVFYIFLVLKWFEKSSKIMIAILYIPFGIFLLMLPITHIFFGVTNIYQLGSPLLSLLFIPFYPLSILLHLIGFGALFDPLLVTLFDLPNRVVTKEVFVSPCLALGYIVLSILAIRYRYLFFALLVYALLLSLYIFT